VIENEALLSELNSIAYVIIVIGAIVIILGFLGFFGAYRESQIMLATVITSP